MDVRGYDVYCVPARAFLCLCVCCKWACVYAQVCVHVRSMVCIQWIDVLHAYHRIRQGETDMHTFLSLHVCIEGLYADTAFIFVPECVSSTTNGLFIYNFSAYDPTSAKFQTQEFRVIASGWKQTKCIQSPYENMMNQIMRLGFYSNIASFCKNSLVEHSNIPPPFLLFFAVFTVLPVFIRFLNVLHSMWERMQETMEQTWFDSTQCTSGESRNNNMLLSMHTAHVDVSAALHGGIVRASLLLPLVSLFFIVLLIEPRMNRSNRNVD